MRLLFERPCHLRDRNLLEPGEQSQRMLRCRRRQPACRGAGSELQCQFGIGQRIARVAVAGGRVVDGALTGEMVVTSCGGCRQSILEAAQLSGTDVAMISVSGDGDRIDVRTIGDLLPLGFGPDNLK